MSIRIVRDADNKWFYGNDWTDWLAEISESTGGSVSITGSLWSFSDPSITEEAETPTDDENGITYLVASGGTNGGKYQITNRITYTVTTPNSVLNVTDLTQDRTVEVELKDQ